MAMNITKTFYVANSTTERPKFNLSPKIETRSVNGFYT